MVEEKYAAFTIEGKHSITFTFSPPPNFAFGTVFEDDVWKGVTLKLLQIRDEEEEADGGWEMK